MKYLWLLSFLLIGCADEVKRHRSDMNDKYEFHYIKDKDKNLCFAVFDGTQRFGLTVVPCENAFPPPPPSPPAAVAPPPIAPAPTAKPNDGGVD